MERHNGVMIGGTCGAVARAGRLTLLVGDADEPLGPDSQIPIAALHLADELAAIGDWEFETVAAALQAFVIDHDPQGVAALLEGDEETMVFLFDRAEAIEFDDHEDPLESERVQRGVDRSGWTTELVSGPWVQLRLGLDPIVPWTELRWGVAIGSSATIAIGESAIHGYDGYEADRSRAPMEHAPLDELPPDDLPMEEVPVHDEMPRHHEPLHEDVPAEEMLTHDEALHEDVPAEEMLTHDEALHDFHETPDPHPAGSLGAAVAATSPYAASSSPAASDGPAEGSGGSLHVVDDLEPDPALDGWDTDTPDDVPDVPPPPPPSTPTSTPPAADLEARDHSLEVDRPDDAVGHAPVSEASGGAGDLDGSTSDGGTVQQTVVVDPSQIGLTRLGEGGVHDQPPPPGPPSGTDTRTPAADATPTSPPSPRPGHPPIPPSSASLGLPPPPGTPPSPDQPPPPAGQPPAADQPPPPSQPSAADLPPPPAGQPPAADQPPPPSQPSAADLPPPPAGQQPAADQPPPPAGETPAADQPPPPAGQPPTGAPPSVDEPASLGAPQAADLPPPPSPPPAGPPPSADVPAPPEPTTSPGDERDRASGQPPMPPGLGRALAPGPAPDGDRPKPPPLDSPEGSLVEPPPGPGGESVTADAGTTPVPPPPTGQPLAGPPPTPPPAAADPSAAPPAPPGPDAQPLPPPAGPLPPPPGVASTEQHRSAGPVVGYLIDAADERTAHPISGTTIIGTNPGNDAEVVIGAASTITLDDPSVHEVHVRIKVNGHEVTAEDAGFGESWVQTDGGPMTMLTSEGERLVPGCQLRVGHRVLLYRLAAAPVS